MSPARRFEDRVRGDEVRAHLGQDRSLVRQKTRAGQATRFTNARAVSQTSRQPLSMVNEWPRPGTSKISVTASFQPHAVAALIKDAAHAVIPVNS
jgi:hypothetical protein